jgi:hypothetical protein
MAVFTCFSHNSFLDLVLKGFLGSEIGLGIELILNLLHFLLAHACISIFNSEESLQNFNKIFSVEHQFKGMGVSLESLQPLVLSLGQLAFSFHE